MKRLYILRHAKAGEHGKVSDIERTIIEKGRNDSLLMAKLLQSSLPDKVLCSPATRCKETIAILLDYWSDKLKTSVAVEYSQKLYMGSEKNFITVLAQQKESLSSVLICGHNPALEDFVSSWLSQTPVQFPTAALAIIDLDIDSWTEIKKKNFSTQLRGLFYPKLLRSAFSPVAANKKLRVAWFMDIFDEVSGIITDTKEIYHEAQKKEIDWYPITSYPQEIEPFTVFPPEYKFPTGRFYSNTYMFVPRFFDVIQFLKEKQINLIVSNTPATMGLIAMSAAKYLKLPLVDIYHTDVDYYMNSLSEGILKPLFSTISLNFLKLYQKQADLIFVRTQDFYKILIKKGHTPSKLRFYPAGVDVENFSPAHYDITIWEQFHMSQETRKIIFVGRITKVKDILFALYYFKNQKPKNCDFVLVGSGPDLENYRQEFADSSNIHFIGAQQGEQLRKIYASAQLLVLPSASETLGKTVLEAMASGVPVLVSDKGGPKDYVDHLKNGFIFRAHNQEHFNEIMNTALSDQFALKEMGRKAFEKVSQFSMEQLFEKFATDVGTLIR